MALLGTVVEKTSQVCDQEMKKVLYMVRISVSTCWLVVLMDSYCTKHSTAIEDKYLKSKCYSWPVKKQQLNILKTIIL